MKKILIKSGQLITEGGVLVSDILLEDGKISKIQEKIDLPSGTQELNAESMYVMPGVIDPHVHFALKAYNSSSCDDFYTGSRAGAAGGVTTFIDSAIPSKGQKMNDRIKEKNKNARINSVIDYSFHAQIIDWDENKAAEMKETINEGVTSFKIFMPRIRGWGVTDDGLFNALNVSRDLKGLIMVHAENGELADKFTEKLIAKGQTSMSDYPDARPDFIEREAVLRAALLAEESGSVIFICHISTRKAIIELRRLKKQGQDIFVETCPQYMLLTNETFNEKEGYLYACCPPLRTDMDTYELWRNVIEGYVDVIGTDHCPYLKSEKKSGNNDFRKTPMGLSGIENSLGLIFSEGVNKRGLDIMQLYRLMSLNPSLIFGLYPEKGTLKEGSDADIVIINPEKTSNISVSKLHSNCDWDPYAGWDIKSVIECTISRGEIIYKDYEVTKEKGRGKFLKRRFSSYYH